MNSERAREILCGLSTRARVLAKTRVLPLHSDEVGEDPRGELGAHMWTEKLRRTARNLERPKSRAGPNTDNGSSLHKEGESVEPDGVSKQTPNYEEPWKTIDLRHV